LISWLISQGIFSTPNIKKLLPVVQRHGKRLTNTIDQRIGSETSAVVEGMRCAVKRVCCR
jgi:hypothetical protein